MASARPPVRRSAPKAISDSFFSISTLPFSANGLSTPPSRVSGLAHLLGHPAVGGPARAADGDANVAGTLVLVQPDVEQGGASAGDVQKDRRPKTGAESWDLMCLPISVAQSPKGRVLLYLAPAKEK